MRYAISSIGLHAIAIPAVLVLEPRLLGGYVVVWFGLLVILSGYQTWGRIYPAEPSFEYRSGSVPLAAVERVRRHRVGSAIVCWISYYSGTKSITTPSLVVLTPQAYRAFETALGVANRSPPDSKPSRRGPKVVAVGIGLGFIVFASGFWLLLDIDPGMSLYLLVVFGGLGLFFMWIGLRYT